MTRRWLFKITMYDGMYFQGKTTGGRSAILRHFHRGRRPLRVKLRSGETVEVIRSEIQDVYLVPDESPR